MEWAREMMIKRERQGRASERGHLLVGLVVLIAVMLIMLTAAAQSWTFLIRRDREAELIQRGEEYARAIAFYHKENQAWPLRLDLLTEKGPHGHRFIRQLYEDPLAEDGNWGVLHLSPTGKGFINPYATQVAADPFAADPFGDPGIRSRQGGGRRNRNSNTPGYSELDKNALDALGGVGLPIVGVVHKEGESGIKIYKGQANLNDWAFTIMAEGQEHNQGSGGQRAPTRSRRPMGIGDHTMPTFLPGMLPPPENAGKVNIEQEMRQKFEEQEKERKRLEEEQRRQQEGDEGEEGDEENPDESSDDPDAGDEAGDDGDDGKNAEEDEPPGDGEEGEVNAPDAPDDPGDGGGASDLR